MSGYSNQNFTQSVIKSGNYTMTTADQHVKVTASATITLPSIATFLAAGLGRKTYYFEVSGSSTTLTIAQNSADTINGSTSNPTYTGDGTLVALTADSVQKNWEIASDHPVLDTVNLTDGSVTTGKLAADAVTGAKIADDAIDSEHYTDGSIDTAHIADAQVTGAKTTLTKFYPPIVADTSGTDPVTVVTAPVAMTIKSVTAIAQDTNAGNMVLKNGTDTVATFAKSTTAGLMTGEEGALTNTAVSAAAAVTIESSTTNGDGRVHVFFEVSA
jgi:hypothetical protein